MTKSKLIFGTVGSPKSTPKRPGGSPGAIAQIRALGMDALELGWVRSVNVKEKTCALIKAAAEEFDVQISVHASYFFNLNATAEEWPKSRKRLIDAAHFGHLAGATDIIFHPGSYFGRPPAEVLEVALPRLRACLDELRANDNPVILRPETMGKSAMLGSLEDTIVMAQEIEGVAPCIDFAHLHARPGDGSVNSKAEFEAILKTIKKGLGAKALKSMHIHMSGIEYGPKGEKKHLPLKEADLQYRLLMQVLAENKCAGRVLMEGPPMEADALLLKKAYEKALKVGSTI